MGVGVGWGREITEHRLLNSSNEVKKFGLGNSSAIGSGVVGKASSPKAKFGCPLR
jgi:hypothetical protein